MDVTPTTWSNPSYFLNHIYIYTYITSTEAICEMHRWFDLRRALLFWGEKWNQGRHGDSATQPCVPGMPPNPWTFPSHRLGKRINLSSYEPISMFFWRICTSRYLDDVYSPIYLVQFGSTCFLPWFILHIVGWYTETPAVRAKIIRVRRLSSSLITTISNISMLFRRRFCGTPSLLTTISEHTT